MKEYYYSDGENQFGPFEIEELKEKKISKETLVWFEGLEEWVQASDIDELQILFKPSPPPLIKISKDETTSIQETLIDEINISKTPKRKKRKKIIIVSFIIILLAGIFILGLIFKNDIFDNKSEEKSKKSNSSSKYDYSPPIEKTPEELKQELYQKERRRPKEYLSVSYSLDYKFFSGKDQIKGWIYNEATLVTFKDVVLIVTYSTGTKTILRKDEFVVYQYVSPGSSAEFDIKTYSPRGTRNISVSVKTAKAA